MEKVTACLITWKRQYNLPQIIDSLTKWPFVSEIIIRDNSKCENIINYGRYTSAQKAENNFIYTQDDDHIVTNLDKLYEVFLKEGGITHTGTADYKRDIPNNIHGIAQMTCMGWGSFFDKEQIWVLDDYIAKYGKDYCFYRETDRIFSILLGKHHTFVDCDILTLPGKNDEHALSNQSDHIRYKKLAIERALELTHA